MEKLNKFLGEQLRVYVPEEMTGWPGKATYLNVYEFCLFPRIHVRSHLSIDIVR